MRVLVCAVAALGLVAAGCRDVCDVEGDAAPDYAQDDVWVCRPGTSKDGCVADLNATRVNPDGTLTVETFTRNATPEAACFYVYPTVDMGIGRGLHNDLSDRDTQANTTISQAGRLQSVCSLHAPLYRQVTLGTYAKNVKAENRQRCFDAAFADVKSAFEQFLTDIGPTKPIILVGHSQGGMHVSRLLRERFDDGGALSKRLVAALPIGWSVATAPGQPTGASFQTLPLCETRGQTGCVVAYRTFGAGNPMPTVAPWIAEGDNIACVNPAGPETPGQPVRMASAAFPVNNPFVKLDGLPAIATPFVEYRNFFSVRTVHDGANCALEVAVAPEAGDVRQNPVNFGGWLTSGDSGTHVLDMQFFHQDLQTLLAEKVAAYTP